jgi:type I restriction enzyme S subunit
MTLPAGWSQTSLGDIAEFIMGQAPPGNACNTRGEGTPFVKAGEFGPARPIIREWTTMPLKMASAEDVLICVVGATAGKLNLGADCSIGRSVAAIRPLPATNAEFLYPRLQLETVRLRASSTGTAQGVISKEMLANVEVILPPKPEQRRIVAKLDALTARFVRTKKELGHIPSLIASCKRLILLLAAEGALTEAWRLQNDLPDWIDVSVESISLTTFDGPFGSNLKSLDYVDDGVRVVRLENIGNLNFNREKKTHISEEKYRALKRHTLEAGDVLFSSFIAEEIRVCLFPDNLPTPAINKADCFCIRPDTSQCLSKYLAYRLASQSSYVELKEAVHGATRPRISLSQLKGFTFSLPSMEEQAEIVRRIESSFDRLDRVAAEHAAATRLLPKLDSAILARAFRGELVPQDPNDEPASVLLARISAEREARLKEPRKSQTSSKDLTMTEKVLSPRDRLLKDSARWPKNGLPFAEIAKRVSLSHDEMRDTLFELLSGPAPALRQQFDAKREQMIIQRIAA